MKGLRWLLRESLVLLNQMTEFRIPTECLPTCVEFGITLRKELNLLPHYLSPHWQYKYRVLYRNVPNIFTTILKITYFYLEKPKYFYLVCSIDKGFRGCYGNFPCIHPFSILYTSYKIPQFPQIWHIATCPLWFPSKRLKCLKSP